MFRIQQKGGQAIFDALQGNSTLLKLNLRSNQITAEACRALEGSLARNGVLAELYLGFNAIQEQGVVCVAAGLQSNVGLRKLDLQGIPVGRPGMEAVGMARLRGGLRWTLLSSH